MYNWILGWGIDSFFLDKDEVQPDEVDVGHGVVATDNVVWKTRDTSGRTLCELTEIISMM
jgi:hypothetical protein